MRAITPEEFQKVPVDGAAVGALQEYLTKLSWALKRARIPVTLEWSIILVIASARLFNLRFRPKEEWDYVRDLAIDFAEMRGDVIPDKKLAVKLGSVKAMTTRLRNAMLKAGLSSHDETTTVALLVLGAMGAATMKIAPPTFRLLCDGAWKDGENFTSFVIQGQGVTVA